MGLKRKAVIFAALTINLELMKISLFIIACIILILAPVVMSGKADVLVPGLKRMRTGTLSKTDLRGIRIVAGIEYVLISAATLAVALYSAWTMLVAAALFILITVFIAFWCMRTFFHAKFTIGDAVSSIIDSVSNLIIFN